LSDRILELRSQGDTYNQIVEKLNCSKSTVAYYCGKDQKAKSRARSDLRRATNTLVQKIDRFKSDVRVPKNIIVTSSNSDRKRFKVLDFQRVEAQGARYRTFTLKDVEGLVGDKPTCYLSGRAIDLEDPSSFEFDHRLPRSKGGDNSLDNLGIASKEANRAKGDLTEEELILLCADILRTKGYTVSK